jgi:hypothetical protein
VAKSEKSKLIEDLVAVSERIGVLQMQLETLQQEMMMLKKTVSEQGQSRTGLAYAHPHNRLTYLQRQCDTLLKDYAAAMAHLRDVVSGNEVMIREEAHAPELAVLGRLM